MHKFFTLVFFAATLAASAQGTWTTVAQGAGSDLNKIAFVNADLAIAVGSDGLVMRTIDGGATWNRMTMPQNVDFNDIAFPAPGVMIAVGQKQFDTALVAISYDSGATWWLPNVDTFPPISSVCFVSANVGFATAHNLVMQTIDGGFTWSATNVGGNFLLNMIRFNDPLHGTVTGGRHDIIGFTMRTADGGATWNTDSTQYVEPITAVRPMDLQHAWRVGGDYEFGAYLSGTSDGGATWSHVVLKDIKLALNDVLFTDAQHGIATGGTYLLQTVDGGDHWTQSTIVDNGYITSMTVSPRGDVWAVGSNGVIMKQTQSPNGVNNGVAVPSFSLLPNYPNPVSSTTEFRFTLDEQTHATLAIYSVDGNRVASVLDGVYDAGDHSATWSANDASGKALPNGTYLVKLSAGETSVTGRLTIVR